MTRYVAFLRGVSPMNLKMAQLRACLAAAGYAEPRTIRSSGNVAFSAPARTERSLAKALEQCMVAELGRGFPTIVRRRNDLQTLLDSDPFAAFTLAPGAKRVITFLPGTVAGGKPALPLEYEGAKILAQTDTEVFSAYVPNGKGPSFMQLIEKTYGRLVTTRTWETVAKCATA